MSSTRPSRFILSFVVSFRLFHLYFSAISQGFMPLPAGCSLRPENRECSSKRVGGKNPSISPIADFLQGFLGTAQAGIEVAMMLPSRSEIGSPIEIHW